MIGITEKPIKVERVINQVKTVDSGCVATYVGLIRDSNRGQPVLTVEYQDPDETAERGLQQIADEIGRKWPVNGLAIVHRIGKLRVGDINLVIAIACGHRTDGFAACQYAVDRFKEIMPTQKVETYLDGGTCTDWQ